MSNATLDLIDALLDVFIYDRWKRAISGHPRKRTYRRRAR